MPTNRHNQTTLASGEFDPLLNAREDVAFYYSSAFLLENVIVLPQSLAKRREGLEQVGLQRGALTAYTISGYTFGAPSGGTAGDVDSTSTPMLTTASIGTTTAYVISTIDAGAAIRLSVADIRAWIGGVTQSSATISLQSSDDAVSYTTRASLVVGTVDLERRFCLTPDTDLGTHRYWRIILDNPSGADFGADVVSIYGLTMLAEAGYSQSGAEPGNVYFKRITTGVNAEYWCVASAGHADLYGADGTWLAGVKIPHTDANIIELKSSQNRDTLILYQRNQPPYVIQRLDAVDDRWRSGAFSFTSVPQFAFDDATTGGLNEIQFINFTGMSTHDRYVLEYNGQVSPEYQWSGTMSVNAANIDAGLQSFNEVSDVSVVNTVGTGFDVTFQGVDGKKFWPTIVVNILTGAGTVQIERKQFGGPDTDDLFSDTRGYPRCGTFYQGRHYMGGFDQAPDVIAGSRSGDFTDFREDKDPVATSPIVFAPDSDDQITIEALYPGRNLQVFTSSGEFYVPSEPIQPDTLALKNTSRRGIYETTEPVDVQGGTLFVDRNGAAIREYLFSEAEQSYNAEPVSTLGGHLVDDPTNLTIRLSRDTDEPTLLYVVNTGRDRDFNAVPAAVCTIDRAQQVTAFARMTTGAAGVFKSFAAMQGGQVAAVVYRELAGNPWHFVELFDKKFMGDCSQEIENPLKNEFTATASQTLFTYTFTSPSDPDNLSVFSRADADDTFRRIEQTEYVLDLTAKTVTLNTGAREGTRIAIAARNTAISGISQHLEGQQVYLHLDGRAAGLHTPSSNAISEINGDEGYYLNARLGVYMVPDVILQTFKGLGGDSPTMKKQRIFRVLVDVERTASLAIGLQSGSPRNVALTNWDRAKLDQDLEEYLFTGVKRISGIGRYENEPRLRITQNEPGPFALRLVNYDIRW